MMALRVRRGGPWLDSLRLHTLGLLAGGPSAAAPATAGLGTASLWGTFPRALNNRPRTGAGKGNHPNECLIKTKHCEDDEQ